MSLVIAPAPEAKQPAADGRDRHVWPIATALFALSIGVYARAGGAAFLDLDDPEYVLANPEVRAGLTARGIVWAFTTDHAANWHPLTWLSHMADVRFFGLEPAGHHWVSIVIHALTTVVLFLVLRRMTGAIWRSALVAALVSLHPLRVESVAWVAERKDILSGFFGVATIGLYARYVERPGAARYIAVVIGLALGLLCKPMLVTLPFVLLLLDAWPLGRLATTGASRLVLEKAPLFALVAASSVATWLAQSGRGAAVSLEIFPLGERVSNAVVSYAAYLGKTVWPAALAPYYPHPAMVHERTPVRGRGHRRARARRALRARRRARPPLALSRGRLALVPGHARPDDRPRAGRLSGDGRPLHVPAADRCLHRGRVGGRRADRASAVAGRRDGDARCVALSATTWVQMGYWRDTTTLYTHALMVTEKNWFVWNNLGVQQLQRGDPVSAIRSFEAASRIKPDFSDAWYNAGVAFLRMRRYQEAIRCYEESLRIEPRNADGWVSLGLAQTATVPGSGSVRTMRTPLYNVGLLHAVRKDFGSARDAYERLHTVDPTAARDLGARIGVR